MENGTSGVGLSWFSVSPPGSLRTAGREGVHSESPTSFRTYCLWFASGAVDRIFVYVFHCGIEKGDLTTSNRFGPPSISMNRTAHSNTTNEGGKVSEISYLRVLLQKNKTTHVRLNPLHQLCPLRPHRTGILQLRSPPTPTFQSELCFDDNLDIPGGQVRLAL